jgi:hypothetical protein
MTDTESSSVTTGDQRPPMTREDFARIALDTAQAAADGYKRNISQFNTEHENDVAEKCAIAASNTGYFILISLGFTPREIIAMADARTVSEHQTGVTAGDDGQRVARLVSK